MKKIAKKLITVLVILLIVIVVLAVAILWHCDSLIKFGTETAGSSALGVPVKVESAHLALTKGSIEFDNFTIDNPPGYQTEYLLDIGNFTAKVDLGSITSDTVVISLIRLEEMTITFEQKGTSSNIQDIIDHIERSQGETEPQPEEPEDFSQRNLRIETVELIDPAVTVKLLPLPGQTDAITVRPGNITLNIAELQEGPGRATLVIQKTLVKILSRSLELALEDLPANVSDTVGPVVEQTQGVLTDIVGSTVEGIVDIFKLPQSEQE